MGFFDWIRVVILGLIEGVTEWLPVSSTGHLMLLDRIWPGNQAVFTPEFTKLFNVVIQIGAILAVIITYFHRLNPISAYKSPEQKKNTWFLWAKILIAVVPAAVIGLLLDDFLDEHLSNAWVVAAMLIVYGAAFLVVETVRKNKEPVILRQKHMTIRTAALIGCFQILALIPGTSRSGVTILGALLLGCSRVVSTEFSFFMGVPVIFGAGLLKFIKYVFKDKIMPTGEQWIALILAMAVAFGISMLVIRRVLKYVKNHDFRVFGVYRILLGILMILIFVLTM